MPNRFTRFVERTDDRMNPVVVRDLRQAVTGRQLSSVLILFLLVQLMLFGLMAFSQNVDELRGGRSVFGGLCMVLVITTVLVMPIIAASRFSFERSKEDMDLLLVTTLSARRVLWGKINAAMLATLMIFGAFTPFLSLTYLMRGIDLPTIFATLVGVAIMSYVCTIYAVSVACCGRNIITRFFAGVFMLGGVMIGMGMTIGFCGAMAIRGVSVLVDAGFWAATFMIGMFTFMVVVAAYAVGLDSLRPSGVRRTASEHMAYKQRQAYQRRRAAKALVSPEAETAMRMSDRVALDMELEPATVQMLREQGVSPDDQPPPTPATPADESDAAPNAPQQRYEGTPHRA
ncbi:MAG: hypothetical protein GC159_10790 [Phycisphaera sp.]|nr:hypothetical protein [Phycisphaera sp.]